MKRKKREKKERLLTDSAFHVAPALLGSPLPSPARRLTAFALDSLLLIIPRFLVMLLFALAAMAIIHPDELGALLTLIRNEENPQVRAEVLPEIAPMLARMDAPGLPPEVITAVEAGEPERAAGALSGYRFEYAFSYSGEAPPLPPRTVRIEIRNLIPGAMRNFATLIAGLLYFSYLTSGRRKGTLGKRLLGLRVVRLEDRPLKFTEAFERAGGYLASMGTFGFGLLDLWRDPNRRLAHDRIAHTVVIREKKREKK